MIHADRAIDTRRLPDDTTDEPNMVDLNALKSDRDADFVAKAGKAIYEELRPRLEKLPAGSYVVIAVETGEYATGPGMREAVATFDAKYGAVLAYVRRIGHLTRV